MFTNYGLTEFTVVTDVLGEGVANNPFALAVPAIDRNNGTTFNQTRTSLTITGLEEHLTALRMTGTVVVSTAVAFGLLVCNSHGEQKVVRKSVDFSADASLRPSYGNYLSRRSKFL